MDHDLREQLGRLLYDEFPCVGYVEGLAETDPIDTDVRVDGTVNFAEFVDIIIEKLQLKRI